MSSSLPSLLFLCFIPFLFSWHWLPSASAEALRIYQFSINSNNYTSRSSNSNAIKSSDANMFSFSSSSTAVAASSTITTNSASPDTSAAKSPTAQVFAITFSIIVILGVIAVILLAYRLNKQPQAHVAAPSTPRPIAMLNRVSHHKPPLPIGGERLKSQALITSTPPNEQCRLLPTKQQLQKPNMLAKLPPAAAAIHKAQPIELNGIHIESVTRNDCGSAELSQQGFVSSTRHSDITAEPTAVARPIRTQLPPLPSVSPPPIPERQYKFVLAAMKAALKPVARRLTHIIRPTTSVPAGSQPVDTRQSRAPPSIPVTRPILQLQYVPSLHAASRKISPPRPAKPNINLPTQADLQSPKSMQARSKPQMHLTIQSI